MVMSSNRTSLTRPALGVALGLGLGVRVRGRGRVRVRIRVRGRVRLSGVSARTAKLHVKALDRVVQVAVAEGDVAHDAVPYGADGETQPGGVDPLEHHVLARHRHLVGAVLRVLRA